MKNKTLYIALVAVALIALFIWQSRESLPIDGIAINCVDEVGSSVKMDGVQRIDEKGTYVPREFITNGGELHVVIKDIRANAVFDSGNSSIIRVGSSEKDWEMIENTLIKLDATEDEYDTFSLEPGQYWLWISQGRNVEIVSCQPDNLSLVQYDEE